MMSRAAGGSSHGLGAHRAHPQGLHRGELHPLHRPWRKPGLDDAVPDATGIKFLAGLGDDFEPVRQDQNGAVALRGAENELAGNDGLAGARRCHQQDAALAGGDGALDLADDVDLIGVQDVGHRRPP